MLDTVYRDKVLGCWLGKAIGGTLGMPFEGKDGPFNLTFYDPVPTQTIPNDDLDLQILWAHVLDTMHSPRVDSSLLALAWVEHVGFPWDEYAVAIRNIKLGLQPPLTGNYDNYFIHGMGAAIRSEIWACLAPGKPALSGRYARTDACIDHAGEGIWAEVFLAALESAAFTDTDFRVLLDSALSTVDPSSTIYSCVTDVRRWYAEVSDYRQVRAYILESYGHENFTDVVQNIGFIVLGLLAGEGDFGKAICTAANCGKDTDCTAATVGAVMGILDPDSIDEKWLAPIGRSLVLSPQIHGISCPDTIDSFTDLIINLRDRIDDTPPTDDVTLPVQSIDHLQIPVAHTFVPSTSPELMNWPAALALLRTGGKPKVLPGCFVTMQASEFLDDILLVKYTLYLNTTTDVRLMCNCSSHNMVWLDDRFQFGRECGRIAPSAHRCPINQYTDVTIEQGNHELIVAIYKPTHTDHVQWVCNLADRSDFQWLAHVFRGLC